MDINLPDLGKKDSVVVQEGGALIVKGHRIMAEKEMKLNKDDIIHPSHLAHMNENEKAEYDSMLSHFTCAHCKHIVNDPRECSGCSVLVCKNCLLAY